MHYLHFHCQKKSARNDWRDEVREFLSSLRYVMLSDKNSPAHKRLIAEVQRAVDMPKEGREWLIKGWTEPQFTNDEIVFLKEAYEKMRQD